MKNKVTIGIIGYGNMGAAIAQRLKEHYQIRAFDKDTSKIKNISGIRPALNCIAAVRDASIVIIAVKPQDFDSVLNEIRDSAEGKLVISIAAGIPTSYIEKHLRSARVVRAMPNLPARIGRGMICICKGKSGHDKDSDATQALFKNLGEVLVLEEKMIDAATAISGSGPGYLYDLVEGKSMEEIKKYTQEEFIPSLEASAAHVGFTPEQAKILAHITGGGSAEYIENTRLLPQELKRQVASKGGTTEAGLKKLKGNVKFLAKAVKAALRRAKELSNETYAFSSRRRRKVA